jgi:hypothetical protein
MSPIVHAILLHLNSVRRMCAGAKRGPNAGTTFSPDCANPRVWSRWMNGDITKKQ